MKQRAGVEKNYVKPSDSMTFEASSFTAREREGELLKSDAEIFCYCGVEKNYGQCQR